MLCVLGCKFAWQAMNINLWSPTDQFHGPYSVPTHTFRSYVPGVW